MHKALFQFYLDTWDYQCENQRDWSRGADQVIENVTQRLNDMRFPSTKRWIYILALGASNIPQKVLEVAQNFQSDPDPLVQLAVAELRKRFPYQ